MSETTRLLNAWKAGDLQAFDDLVALLYDDLKRSALGVMGKHSPGSTLQPTELVHESFLRLQGLRELDWQNRAHFLGMSGRVMRQVLVDNARKNMAAKRRHQAVTLVTLQGSSLGRKELDLEALDEALIKLDEINPLYVQIVEMKFFAGMTHAEIAIAIDKSESTVKRTWRVARAWLESNLAN